MKKIFKYIFLFVLFPLWGLGGFGWASYAQLYPVQLTPVFNSPYSLKLSDYATSMDAKMQLLINPTDISINNRQVRLKFSIQGNGINAKSTDFIQGENPIFINGGELQTLTNVDIAALFRLENLQGISAVQYANPLPEGMYDFCFEMYDFATNQKISQKSCSMLYLILNDPPLLNTPQRNEQIAATDFPNILFTWTPRQINATNVSYTYELKELLDPSIDPQYGFQMAPLLYQETDLRSTAMVYDLGKPNLIPGKRYAWRVRAVSMSGLSENSIYKNDGYSEVFSFKYTPSCNAPTFLLSESQSTKSVKITWQGVPEHTRYQLQYKKQDVRNAQWFSSSSLNTQSLITNLEPGVTYEFRVGSSCDAATEGVQSFTYSGISTFTTPTETNGVKAYNCGIIPKISIQNQKPIDNLIVSETFTAGDFPVTILELDEQRNPYSGRGYIIVPYLADTKIAVEFSNITINTDYQLINGLVETSYNPDWKNVADIGNVLESVESLINRIDATLKELLENGTITKEEEKKIREDVKEQEKIIKDAEEAQTKLDEKLQQAEEKALTSEEKNAIAVAKETEKQTINDTTKKLIDKANALDARAGKGKRESDGYFQGLLPLAVNDGAVQVKQIEGNGTFTFKITDNKGLETYSTVISGKKYTFVITTSNSTKEELDKAKSMVDNPTSGIVIYNHYDLKNDKLGYKVNFGRDYYNNPKQYSPEALNALFVYALNDKLNEAKNVTDWGSEIFKITSQIDSVFQEVINKVESTLFTKEGLQHFQETLAFMKKCKSDYALQKEGYIPRCLWDHNQNVPYVNDMAFSAGFTDGLIETVVGVFQMSKFASCWDFTSPTSFFSSDCIEIRDKTQQVLQLAYTTFSDYDKFSTATGGAWSSIKGYTDESSKLDNQARYNQGKIVFNVASLFIGAGEAKAILKGETTLVAVLKESLLAYKNLPKSISKLVLNSSKNVKAVLQKTGAEFYLFYKLNTAELKFGSVLNGTFKADNWITAGKKLETIENCAYLGKDGKIVTGTIEVVEKDGVVGVRVLEDAQNQLAGLFAGARQGAIAKFGKEAEDLIYVKFNKDGGAAAEILDHYGDDGLNALKKVTNIQDATNELLKGKIAYRHVSSNVSYLEQMKISGKIPSQTGTGTTYFSLDKFDDPIIAIDKMQLNSKGTDAAWRVEFDATQLTNKAQIPSGKWNNAEYIEVLTRSYPNFGSGGASQFITQSEITLKRLVNLKTGEIINF
jgi:polyhydroxyalkanoate synthesis regulator phasin